MRNVPIGIQILMGQHAYEWNEMMVMSILSTFPVLIMYMVAQRYFLKGLKAGSVKN
jgi:multiple sugar transport system permease protein